MFSINNIYIYICHNIYNDIVQPRRAPAARRSCSPAARRSGAWAFRPLYIYIYIYIYIYYKYIYI